MSLKRVHSFGRSDIEFYILDPRQDLAKDPEADGLTIRAKLQSRDGVFAMFRRWVGE